MAKTKWYKVLSVRGYSCSGGHHQWSLPRKNKRTGEWIPGKWQTYRGKISICHRGFHITTRPRCYREHAVYSRVFLVEVHKDARKTRRFDCWDDKIAVSKLRLVRELYWYEAPYA